MFTSPSGEINTTKQSATKRPTTWGNVKATGYLHSNWIRKELHDERNAEIRHRQILEHQLAISCSQTVSKVGQALHQSREQQRQSKKAGVAGKSNNCIAVIAHGIACVVGKGLLREFSIRATERQTFSLIYCSLFLQLSFLTVRFPWN